MQKPKNAKEMKGLLLDYIDALLLGGIPKMNLDIQREEPDMEKLATEMSTVARMVTRFVPDEFGVMLEGVRLLYSEDRENATERCYAMFWQVQQMQSVTGKLKRCYEMLQILNFATGEWRTGMYPGTVGATI